MNEREAERRLIEIQRTGKDSDLKLVAEVVVELAKKVADLEEELRRLKQQRR